MNKLPASLKNKAKKYNSLTKSEKKKFISDTYEKHKMSFHEIAELCETYPNKIRRHAKNLGIEVRSKGEAQSVALESGRHKHPTKGTEHSLDTKIKISDKMAETWEGLTDEQREYRSEIGRKHWDSLSEAEQERFRAAAGEAVRKAAKNGSKLENFLYESLTKENFIVEFHRERIVTNQRLQVDLFLPALNIAMEVDGPSHFLPIWGQERLESNRRSDSQKAGLILTQGWCLLRVRQTKALSQKYKRDILAKVLDNLRQIKKKFPPRGKRMIIIGGEEYI